jgi:hypothetical protein
MRQTMTAEVRLDHGKAAGSGITRRAIRWFGCEQRRSQSNFVAAKPPGTEDQVQRDWESGEYRLKMAKIAPRAWESGECQLNRREKPSIVNAPECPRTRFGVHGDHNAT